MPSFRAFYKKALLLYPEQYRKAYGAQIMQTMEDMLANEPSAIRRVGIWLKEILVLPGNVLEQHMAAIARRGGLTSGVLMGFIALALLVPFFMAMLLDEISERMYGQHLYGSWFWSRPILTVWVIILPVTGLFIALTTYLVLILRASIRLGRISFQIKRLWLVIVAAVVSSTVLGIVAFHDSTGCWLGHTTNVTKAIQCTETVFLNSDKT